MVLLPARKLKRKISMVKFRTRLRQLMAERGLERMDIVRAAGISYPTVVKWETESLGTIEAPVLDALLKVLEVSQQDLIYLEEISE